MNNMGLYNYAEIIEMSDDELFETYMKMTKKELIQMLIQNNRIIDSLTKNSEVYINPEYCNCEPFTYTGVPYYYYFDGNVRRCIKCGKPIKETDIKYDYNT